MNLDSAVARGALRKLFGPKGVTKRPRCTSQAHLRFFATLCIQSIRTLHPRSTSESKMKRTVLCFVLCLGMFCPRAYADSKATSLRVLDMQGQQYSFSSILQSGSNIALVFWQPWCVSCKKEAPQLEKAAQALGGKIQFFGVVSGPDEFVDDEKVRAFMEKYELTYPQIRDRNLVLTDEFEVKGTPTIVVLSTSGDIVYRGHHAPDEWEPFSGTSMPLEASMKGL